MIHILDTLRSYKSCNSARACICTPAHVCRYFFACICSLMMTMMTMMKLTRTEKQEELAAFLYKEPFVGTLGNID